MQRPAIPTEGQAQVSANGAGEWTSLLVLGKTRGGVDKVLPIVANAVAILVHDPSWRGVFAWDAFRDAVVCTRAPPWDAVDAPTHVGPGECTDADVVRVSTWLARHYNLALPVSQIEQAISVVATRIVVHPVRDWLASLVWDQEPRIDHLFCDYFGAEDSEYVRGVSYRFMLGAVARVFQPGAKVDCTPVLEGDQGIGKSTGIEALASPAFFFDTPIVMGDKDGYQALRGKWIGELGELHSLTRVDMNRAKNFLSATTDNYRPSYARRSRDFPRQCVFVGSTNADKYLRDETGNRRFWPVRCGTVDVEAITRDRSQLWAEAVERYRRGEKWHAHGAEFVASCEEEQEDRFVRDEWEERIGEWLTSPSHPERVYDGVTIGEVLEGCIKLLVDRWDTALQMRVGKVLRKLGWTCVKQSRNKELGGKRERRYRPTSSKAVTDAVTV